MSDDSPATMPPALPATARRFIGDLAQSSGRKGAFGVAFVVLGALVEGVGLAMVVPLLGLVTASSVLPGPLNATVHRLFATFGAETVSMQLALLTGVFALVMLVRAAVLAARGILLAELQIGFVETQRLRVTRHLVEARWDHVARLRHARITHVMSGDIQRIAVAANATLQGSAAAVMLLAQCGLTVLLSPQFALIAFVLLAVGLVGLVPVMRRARRLGHYVTNMSLKLLDDTAQFLGGLKIAVSQNQHESYLGKFQATLRALAQRQVATMRQQVTSQLAMATLSALIGAILVLAGFSVFHIAAPVLLTLLLIIVRMSGPAMQVQQSAQQLAASLSAYEKVCELNDELVAAKQMPVAVVRPLPPGPVVLEQVSFCHRGASGAGGVDGLDLVIGPGEFLGIGGPSGAGKTTLADLLVGLFPPQSGRITVGGVVLDDTTRTAWRNAISYVSQDPFLFHDTVRGNLGWANAASEEQMWQALALAGADDVVRRLEHGLDSMVGERGSLLSGGERQRIALARAVLRHGRLLVLDEATNAIDVAGEREILVRLAALASRPAVVMIAHRPESHALCERVLWLDRGRLTSRELP